MSRHEREVLPVSRHERETVTTSHYDDFALRRRPSISTTSHYGDLPFRRPPITTPFHFDDLPLRRPSISTTSHYDETFLTRSPRHTRLFDHTHARKRLLFSLPSQLVAFLILKADHCVFSKILQIITEVSAYCRL